MYYLGKDMTSEPGTSNRIKGEWLEREGCFSNDFNTFVAKLRVASRIHRLQVEELGSVQGKPILLISPQKPSDGSRVLIAGGFHGDESAGSWGILRFLESITDYPTAFRLSFLPLVNPTGFESIRRTNHLGQDPNRGYYHTKSGIPEPSEEGLILLGQLSRIKTLARDIFLSLHEDWEFTKFYIYSFEDSIGPGPFSQVLQSAERRYFDPYPDGPLEGGAVKDGIIFRLCDGSFEDMLFHSGVPMTACTETPGKLGLDRRIEANSFIIQQVGRFALSLTNNSDSQR
jgi:hypothetical protein